MTDKKNIRTIQAFIPPPSERQVMCVDMTDEDKEATTKKKERRKKERQEMVEGWFQFGLLSPTPPRV